jgi:TOMM system kinase/cyclase fusion protein
VSFIEAIERARAFLERNGRVSVRVLKREFGLDDEGLDELVRELVDVQQVAARAGNLLCWRKPPSAGLSTAGMEMATAVLPEPAAAPDLAAERRQLTVMFCDLVGSTALSERLDPEDLREVLRAYQESCAEVIHRFGGHLAKYLGDGLLVYFGYPQAHEDDAERSVRAGLGIVEEMHCLDAGLEAGRCLRLAVRVGIHTGLVVAGKMGTREQREPQGIIGETPNIAARLQEFAAPGTVVVSNTTLRLIQGLFVIEELGSPAFKGVSEPVQVYRVLRSSGVRSRLDVAARLTPFVGRQQEVGLLLDRWERVQEGMGQAVLISGEAGVGKSRLVQILRERLTATPHTWLECRCSFYTQNSAFYPVIDLLQRVFGFAENDSTEDRVRKLERGLLGAVGSRPESEPLFRALLSLPDRHPVLETSPDLRRRRTLEALVSLMLGLAEQQAVLLLVEDLHWCDPSTLELLELLLDQGPTARILLLLTFRPEFEPPWPTRSHLTPIHLNRLRRRQAREMISGVSAERPLPATVGEEIVERADGIPLFVEELTRMVLESGLLVERDGQYQLAASPSSLAIPTTLQDSLMARLDRLSAAKDVAQLGATLGREFSYELLRAVSPDDEATLQRGLERLVNAEVLYQRGLPPRATYIFKHSLIQETAYQSLLKRTRREIHARIARTLEEHFVERVASEPEVIARHYEEAGLAARAIPHYQRAGELAAERSAHREAVGHLRRAIALLETLSETPERHERELSVQIALGALQQATEGFSSPVVRDTYQRVRMLCGLVRDPRRLAVGLWGLRAFHLTSGDLEAAHELADALRRLGQESGESVFLAAGEYGMGSVAYYQGRFAAALEHSQQAIAYHDASRSGELIAGYALDFGITARCYASLASWPLGHVDRALKLAEQAVDEARRIRHPLTLGFALVFAAVTHKACHHREAVERMAAEAISLSERHGFQLFLAGATLLHGWSRSGAASALDEVQAGVAIASQTGNQTFAPLILGGMAELNEGVGRLEEALAAIEMGLAISAQHGMTFWDAELQRQKGDLVLKASANAENEAERLFRAALQIARRQGAKSLELRAAMSLARLWRQLGRKAAARDLLAPIHACFTEGLATKDLRDAGTLLEELDGR